MLVLREMFPSENVTISKLGFIACPRSNLDLEGSVVAMEPKEVIDCGLGQEKTISDL